MSGPHVGHRLASLNGCLDLTLASYARIAHGPILRSFGQRATSFNAAMCVLFMHVHAPRRMNMHHSKGHCGVRVATNRLGQAARCCSRGYRSWPMLASWRPHTDPFMIRLHGRS